MTPRRGPGGVDLCVVVCGGTSCHTCDARLLDRLGPVVADTTGGVLIRAECLQPCQRAPVVLVQGHVEGAPPITIAMTPANIDQQQALAAWIRAGGPGVAPLSPVLDDCVFSVT